MKRRDLLFGGAALTAMSAWPRLNAAAPATNNLVAFIGDSRTVDAFRTGTLSTVGYPAWARALGGGRLVFDQSLVFAKGGAVSGEITAAFLEPCIASDAATVVCMMGTNDSRRVQRSLDSTLANYRKLVEATRAAGKALVICDETPCDDDGLVDRGFLFSLHQALYNFASQFDHVRIAKTWDALATFPDSLTPRDDVLRDGLHFSPVGAFAAGAAVWSELRPTLPSAPPDPKLIWSGRFDRLGGSKTAGVSGEIPLNWRLDVEAGSPGSVSTAIEGDILTIRLRDMTGGNIRLHSQLDIGQYFKAGEHLIQAHLHCEIVNAENLGRVATGAMGGDGMPLPMVRSNEKAWAIEWQGTETALPLPEKTGPLLIDPLPAEVPAAGGQIRQLIAINTIPGRSCNAEIRLVNPGLARIALQP